MLKRLSELINQAENSLENLGLSEGTIEDYRYSAFHPLERRLDTKEYVDSAAILSQEEFFWEQYSKQYIAADLHGMLKCVLNFNSLGGGRNESF